MGLLDLRWNILVGYGPLFLQGLVMTLQLTIVSISGGLVLGVVLGLISSTRDSPRPASPLAAAAWSLLRGVTRAYVGFFRGTPLFVQILLVHFALMPPLIQPDGGLLLSGEAAREFRQSHVRSSPARSPRRSTPAPTSPGSCAPASRASTAARPRPLTASA